MMKKRVKTILEFAIVLSVLLFFYYTRSNTGYNELEGIYLFKDKPVIVCIRDNYPYDYYFLCDATDNKQLFLNVTEGDVVKIKCVVKNESLKEINVFECKIIEHSDEETVQNCISFFYSSE